MSEYKPRRELNPTADNPLVALITKIENLLAAKTDDIVLARSALVSAILRIEMINSHSSERETARSMAHVFKNIASTCEN